MSLMPKTLALTDAMMSPSCQSSPTLVIQPVTKGMLIPTSKEPKLYCPSREISPTLRSAGPRSIFEY